MALTRVNLTIETTKGDDCASLFLEDQTGSYNAVTNPLGYGVTNGAAVNDVTSVVVVLRYSSLGTYLTYTFTVASGTITAATLAMGTATATDILAELASTTWPFVSPTLFELTADYGVTIPSVTDGVYETEYTISGTASDSGTPTAFSYTTSEQFVLACTAKCCISKLYAALDPSCACCDEAQDKADEAYTWLQVAYAAAEYGDTTKAVAALKKAQELCDCGCSGC